MKLYNPTNESLEIQYNGSKYSIKAGETKEIENEVAKHWKDTIHLFLEDVDSIKASTFDEEPEHTDEEETDLKSEEGGELLEGEVSKDEAPEKTKKTK
jgi:hypothetical protein